MNDAKPKPLPRDTRRFKQLSHDPRANIRPNAETEITEILVASGGKIVRTPKKSDD